MSTPIRYMDIKEFREEGYLQEVNRLFLHPLGLAMEIIIADDGSAVLGGIWDSRDDPEGIAFGDRDLVPKASRIAELWASRAPAREAALGWVIQPPGSPPPAALDNPTPWPDEEPDHE